MTRDRLIDPNLATPLFQQIVDALEGQILAGTLPPGTFLTSVREFAVQHQVNPNTVAKAYQHLQSKGLVDSVRGLGLRVTAIDAKVSRNRRHKLVEANLDAAVHLAQSLKVSPTEFLEFVKERIKKWPQ